MYLKSVKAGKYEYIRLVESYRDGDKVNHKVLLNLGRKDVIQGNPSFQRMAERLAELSGAEHKVPDAEVSDGVLRNYGFVVYRRLWELFGLHNFLAELRDNHTKLQFDLNATCLLMAIQHLLQPRSKLSTFSHRNFYLGTPELNLNHLYRSLDVLAEHKEDIEDYIFEKNRSLFNMCVDIVFYDVTTFHFESCRDDGFRDFGFSKANKINEVQIVMGLLVDNEGRPIGYELFPGNTVDGKTLESSLEKLKERFNIRKVIVVADRGLNSKMNLGRIKAKGYDYIVASRLKKMSKAVRDQVFDPQGYTIATTTFEDENGEVPLSYKVLDYTNSFRDEEGKLAHLAEKLVITYSAKRARKDRADRTRLVEKAEKLLTDPAKIKASNKRGGKRFIQHRSENDQFTLDEQAIAADERFDGYYAIQTSLPDMSAEEVVEAYHSLWKIEESFRIMKSTLEVRPIFHWTEKRIKGHFAICFLAFLLERTLEFKLRKSNMPMSPTQIQEALNSLLFAELTMKGQQYLLKMKPTPEAGRILRLMRIAPPKNMLAKEESTDFTW